MAVIHTASQVLAGSLAATNAVRTLLHFIGEDSEREGLRQTPERVTRSLAEMTSGYQMEPGEILSTCFTDSCDEMVVVSGIEFYSLCEHHMLPFFGTASVGYLPAGKVLGLSKIPRLVECFARRLQIQERLTGQIAEAIQEYLEPLGTGVIIRASHFCVACRGVQKANTRMTTSSLLGKMRDASVRAEFLSLA